MFAKQLALKQRVLKKMLYGLTGVHAQMHTADVDELLKQLEDLPTVPVVQHGCNSPFRPETDSKSHAKASQQVLNAAVV